MDRLLTLYQQTPKASTFGDISLPTQPKFNFPPALSYPTCATTAESHLGLHGLALPSNVSGVPAQGSSRPTTPAQPQAPGLDRMWNSIFQEPFGQSGVSGPSMLSSLDESAPSPFGASDLSGPIDFDNMSFPSLFPESD